MFKVYVAESIVCKNKLQMQTCSLKNKPFTGLLPGKYGQNYIYLSIISVYVVNLVICHLMKTEHAGTGFFFF